MRLSILHIHIFSCESLKGVLRCWFVNGWFQVEDVCFLTFWESPNVFFSRFLNERLCYFCSQTTKFFTGSARLSLCLTLYDWHICLSDCLKPKIVGLHSCVNPKPCVKALVFDSWFWPTRNWFPNSINEEIWWLLGFAAADFHSMTAKIVRLLWSNLLWLRYASDVSRFVASWLKGRQIASDHDSCKPDFRDHVHLPKSVVKDYFAPDENRYAKFLLSDLSFCLCNSKNIRLSLLIMSSWRNWGVAGDRSSTVNSNSGTVITRKPRIFLAIFLCDSSSLTIEAAITARKLGYPVLHFWLTQNDHPMSCSGKELGFFKTTWMTIDFNLELPASRDLIVNCQFNVCEIRL